jgi:hypothetical protein
MRVIDRLLSRFSISRVSVSRRELDLGRSGPQAGRECADTLVVLPRSNGCASFCVPFRRSGQPSKVVSTYTPIVGWDDAYNLENRVATQDGVLPTKDGIIGVAGDRKGLSRGQRADKGGEGRHREKLWVEMAKVCKV